MIALYIFIGLVAFFFMKFIAWSSHKYLMHGVLWKWHKYHHRLDSKKAKMPLNNEAKHFEKNDKFFNMYATLAIILLIVEFSFNIPILIALGIGITACGMTYFIIHDVIFMNVYPYLSYTT